MEELSQPADDDGSFFARLCTDEALLERFPVSSSVRFDCQSASGTGRVVGVKPPHVEGYYGQWCVLVLLDEKEKVQWKREDSIAQQYIVLAVEMFRLGHGGFITHWNVVRI